MYLAVREVESRNGTALLIVFTVNFCFSKIVINLTIIVAVLRFGCHIGICHNTYDMCCQYVQDGNKIGNKPPIFKTNAYQATWKTPPSNVFVKFHCTSRITIKIETFLHHWTLSWLKQSEMVILWLLMNKASSCLILTICDVWLRSQIFDIGYIIAYIAL